MSKQANLRAISAPWWGGVEFLFKDGKGYGIEVVMAELVDGVQVNPTFELSMDAARQLMDDLWACGIRPSQGVDNAGQLKATENHLKDMQQLAWTLLPKVIDKTKAES